MSEEMEDRLARAIDPQAFEVWENAGPHSMRSLDQMTRKNHAYAAADRVLKVFPLHDVWGVGQQDWFSLDMAFERDKREDAERVLSRLNEGANDVELADPAWWKLFHWVESDPERVE